MTAGSEVVVRIAKKEHFLTVSILDHGPGLSDDAKEKLTEPFYTTKSNGTGLGLPVVNAVVRAHHGKLDFFNQPEGGACFVISLPLKEETIKHGYENNNEVLICE